MDESYLAVLNSFTFGVIQLLEKKPGICDVRYEEREPVHNVKVAVWEKNKKCSLPEDLKRFYYTSDGVSILWSVKFKTSVISVGHMNISSLSELTALRDLIPADGPLSFDDIETEQEQIDGRNVPRFSDTIFCLDKDGEYGTTCLVSDGSTGSSIWFLDRSLQWHFLSNSFTNYFRMLVLHLGIPGWQYTFTEAGMSSTTEHWCNMYMSSPVHCDRTTSHLCNPQLSPALLSTSIRESTADTSAEKSGSEKAETNILDSVKVFKQRWDKKKATSDATKGRGTPTKGGKNPSTQAKTAGKPPTYRR